MQPSFDAHAFAGKRNRPVSSATGISYEDYSRMTTHSHKLRGERRTATPIWARDDNALKDLLVRFMEKRALLRPGTGTLQERLVRAVERRKAALPELEATLARLGKEYVACKAAELFGPAFTKVRRSLEMEIQALDSQIQLISRNEPALLLRVVYLYFRAEMNSVNVAAEVGIKPPAVRQIIWKLDQLWNNKRTNPKCKPRVSDKLEKEKRRKAAPARKYSQTKIAYTLCGFCRQRPALPGKHRCLLCKRCRKNKFPVAAAVILRAHGVSCKRSAKILGVSQGTISNQLRPTGLSFSHGYRTRSREDKIAAGLCGWCAERPPLPGRTRCESCRDKNRAARANYGTGYQRRLSRVVK